jgi:hypothetical protein
MAASWPDFILFFLLISMELQRQRRGQTWCNHCQQATSDFLEKILNSTKSSQLFSPIFTVNISPSLTLECPLCHLLRASITLELLDPRDYMDVRLRFQRSDPKSDLVFIESVHCGYPFNMDRGRIKILTQDGINPQIQLIKLWRRPGMMANLRRRACG